MQHLLKNLLVRVPRNQYGYIGVLLMIAIALLLWQYSQTPSENEWESFVAEHHCTANKFKDDKNLKSGWLCDDGKEYYRWRQQL